MRRLFVLFVVVAAMLVACAEDKGPLLLSKSVMAIKITDPERQVIAFAPLLGLVDDFIATVASGSKFDAKHTEKSATTELTALADKLAKVPGINAKGDLWMVIMPALKDAEVAPLDGKGNVNPAAMPPMYVVLPLDDAAAFQTYAKGSTKPAMFVSGDYGIITMNGKAPAFEGVTFDLPLVTKRDIVLSMQMSNMDVDAIKAKAPPMMQSLLTPITDLLDEQKRNFLRAEIGIAMVKDDLSLESFVIPVPNSPLAKCLANDQPDGIAVQYAGYLPENLAVCSASGPLLQGSPGSVHALLKLAFSFLNLALPPSRAQAFNKSLDALMAQCTQGRALGIITPPRVGAASSTLVAVYHVTDAQTAKTAVRTFVKELTLTRDAVMGGMLSNTITLDLKPEGEMIGEVPVDIVKVTITAGDESTPAKPPTPPVKPSAPATKPTAGSTAHKAPTKATSAKPAPKPAPKPAVKPAPVPAKPASPFPTKLVFECRLGYLDDKMLVTFGYDARQQMEALVTRVQQQQPGFTAGARYQELKAMIPQKARAFETCSLLDLCTVGVSWVPGDSRKDMQKFLSIFPQQNAVISTYEEIQDGRLHSEIIIPNEEFKFVFSLAKAAMTQFGDTKKPALKPTAKPAPAKK